MPKFIDRAGQRFGRLLVLEEAGRNQLKKVIWKCQCDCGNTVVRTAGDLVTGNSVSCGCYLKERITKHGGWKKSSYNTWRAMMRRCTNPNDKDYPRYGKRGIQVSPEWTDYLCFEKDMGEPTGNQTLDRIDPYKGYSKENCRWASPEIQARNIRVPKRSTTGVIGVMLITNGKWLAYISHKRKKYYSKLCFTLDAAIQARKQLEEKHWNKR